MSILVDLERRERRGEPVRIAVVGTGFFGGGMTSALPPLASILASADLVKWCALKSSFLVSSPSPRIRTPSAAFFARPFAFLRHTDPAMVATTWRDFVPALPTNTGSIAYIAAGMILGFLAYEIVKLPVITLVQEPRRRKFRRRG